MYQFDFLKFCYSHQDTTLQVFVDLSYKWSSINGNNLIFAGIGL